MWTTYRGRTRGDESCGKRCHLSRSARVLHYGGSPTTSFAGCPPVPTVPCKSCGRLLDLGGAFAGRQALCPVCLGPMPVPPVSEESLGPWRRWWWVVAAAAAALAFYRFS